MKEKNKSWYKTWWGIEFLIFFGFLLILLFTYNLDWYNLGGLIGLLSISLIISWLLRRK